jgi:hypothetical protein
MTTMRSRGRVALIIAIGLLAGLPWMSARADDARGREVVIRAAALEPDVVQAGLHERVTFRNRSGQIVHVQFLGEEGQHHVFQVPGSIWAEFHQPGPHPFIVHLSGGSPAELAGRVDVDDNPALGASPRECNGRLTVDTVCIPR